MWELFLKVKEQYSLTDISKKLNVAIGTVRRWNDKKEVPESYRFDLMKMINQPINYNDFSYKDKDQFFTPEDIAKKYINLTIDFLNDIIDINEYIFIEPSAGNGSFYNYLKQYPTIGMDIESSNDEILIQDFLDWEPDKTKKYIVIGNPPFGLRGQKALQFINKSFEFADFVCFILPPLFNSDGKGSPKKRIDAHLIFTEEISNINYFYPNNENISINTIFQIWSKNDVGIELNENINPIGYKIYSLSDGGTPSSTRNKDKLYICDYYLPSTVFGIDKMKLYNSFEDLPQRRGYGIILEDLTLKNNIEQINWSKEAFRSTNNAVNLRTSIIIKAIENSKI